MQTSESFILTPTPPAATTTSTTLTDYPAVTVANSEIAIVCTEGDTLVCSGSLLLNAVGGGEAWAAIRVYEGGVSDDGTEVSTLSATPTAVAPFHRYTVLAAGTVRVRFAFRTSPETSCAITAGATNSLQVTRYYEEIAVTPTPEPTAPVYETGDVVPTTGVYRPSDVEDDPITGLPSTKWDTALTEGDPFPISPYTKAACGWSWISFLSRRKPIVVTEETTKLFGVTCTITRQYDPNQAYNVSLSPNPQYSASLDLYGKSIRPVTSEELTRYGITSLSPPKVELSATLPACISSLKRAVDTLIAEDTQPQAATAPKSTTGKNLLAQHKVHVLCLMASWKVMTRSLGWQVGSDDAESRDDVIRAFAATLLERPPGSTVTAVATDLVSVCRALWEI